MRRDSPPGLLLIDSEPAQAGLISALVQRAGWRVLRASDVAAAIDLLRASDMRDKRHRSSPSSGDWHIRETR